MNSSITLYMAVLCALGMARAAVQAETHGSLQSVKADGTSAWSGTYPLIVTGVLLNNPEDMLAGDPNFLPWENGANAYRMGGEWQIVIQAVEAGDRGGTTCWMGQNYGNQPWLHNSDLSYSNQDWIGELNRLNYGADGHHFRAGDLVQITASRSLFYGGKRNINEAHDNAPEADFTVSLVTANYGLPVPEIISLEDVVRPDDANPATHEDVFDATRATGGEHYQGMRVRMNNLKLANDSSLANMLGANYYGPEGWNASVSWSARRVTVTDGLGRYFTLRMPRYSLGAAPTNAFDAIGIFSQESGSGSDGTFGYELFVQEIVQPPPALNIALNAVISWPANGTPYIVESAPDAVNGPWTVVTNAPAVINGQNVLLEVPNGQKFYRLRNAP